MKNNTIGYFALKKIITRNTRKKAQDIIKKKCIDETGGATRKVYIFPNWVVKFNIYDTLPEFEYEEDHNAHEYHAYLHYLNNRKFIVHLRNDSIEYTAPIAFCRLLQTKDKYSVLIMEYINVLHNTDYIFPDREVNQYGYNRYGDLKVYDHGFFDRVSYSCYG